MRESPMRILFQGDSITDALIAVSIAESGCCICKNISCIRIFEILVRTAGNHTRNSFTLSL